MASAEWTELAIVRAKPLPAPLLEVLGMPAGGKWLRIGDAATDFQPMPPLVDMAKWSKAFASLGRCSVAVGLYMAGSLKQLHYPQKVARLEQQPGSIRVMGHLEAGYYHLLSDTFVVPHQFHCWWRLVHTLPGLLCEPTSESASGMPPVQNLGVDVGAGMSEVDPPLARRPWLPHQSRSFRWMVYREAVKDLFVCESSTALPCDSKNSSGFDVLKLEWKMDKAFDLRGGVLCDPVGSGKTATMLGLVLNDSKTVDWACEVKDVASDCFAASWLTVNATLVLCPDHVHEQWVKEIGRALRDDAMEVLSIRTVTELRAAAPQLKALTEQDARTQSPVLVVVPLSVIQEREYEELISPSNQDLKVWLQGTDEWRRGMALDCFVWRRLIIDEVHEVVHTCTATCSTACPQAALIRYLRALKSERRWGLTGTAQDVLRDPKSVQSLAQIFRTDFNSENSSRRFIEHYCRTNQVDVPARVQEQLVVIEHTGAEKLIYQQHARDFSTAGLDGTGEKPLAANELLAAVPLLKMCSHFRIDELSHFQNRLDATSKLNILTASDVARSVYEMKLQTMEHAQAAVDSAGTEEMILMAAEDAKPEALELSLPVALLVNGFWAEPKIVDGEPKVIITRTEAAVLGLSPGDMLTSLAGKPVFEFARHFLKVRSQLEALQDDTPFESGVAALSHDLQIAQRDLHIRQQLREVFQDEIRNRAGPHSSMVIAWRRNMHTGLAEATFLRKQAITAKHTQWHNATSSFAFMRRLWETLCATGQELKRSCPVCLDHFDAAQGGAVLRCGHLYCNDCCRHMFGPTKRNQITAVQKCCPLCRLPVRSAADIVDLKDFAVGRESAASIAEDARKLGTKDGRHGSKLQRVADVLRDILSRKDERAIVFCQFADLELQISQALADFGIAHARLSAAKDIFEQTAVLDTFQQKKGQSRVLLLSLEQSASGTNLTAANHVLLVHPMAASTAERAVAFEQQAIGRCVRLGQKREVTVWRFVTKGTVEELLDRRFSDHRRSYMTGLPLKVKAASPSKDSPSDPACSDAAGSGREAVMALRREPGRRTTGRASRSARSAVGAAGQAPRRSRSSLSSGQTSTTVSG